MIRPNKKVILSGAAILIVSVFAYYQTATRIVGPPKNEETAVSQPMPIAGSRQISAVATFDAPNDVQEELRFTLDLDKSGTVIGAKTVDARTGQASEKQEAFSQNLLTIIKGKKLKELGPVDKIGTSSLTTKAFNDSLDELKAQL